MSNLGKIYVINIHDRTKYVYPVVYMNRDYIYCKDHGCTQLKSFNAPGSQYYSRAMDYDIFKTLYDNNDIDEKHTYTIYVPAHVKTYFEWIKEKSTLELQIEELQNEIKYYSTKINEATDAIDRINRHMKRYETIIVNNQLAIEELQRQLVEERSNV